MAETKEQQSTEDGQEKKFTELDLIMYFLGKVVSKELNKYLMDTDVINKLFDKILIAEFKANICYELLTEGQRKQARQLLQDRFKAEGIEFTQIETVLERAKAKL